MSEWCVLYSSRKEEEDIEENCQEISTVARLRNREMEFVETEMKALHPSLSRNKEGGTTTSPLSASINKRQINRRLNGSRRREQWFFSSPAFKL